MLIFAMPGAPSNYYVIRLKNAHVKIRKWNIYGRKATCTLASWKRAVIPSARIESTPWTLAFMRARNFSFSRGLIIALLLWSFPFIYHVPSMGDIIRRAVKIISEGSVSENDFPCRILAEKTLAIYVGKIILAYFLAFLSLASTLSVKFPTAIHLVPRHGGIIQRPV